MWFLWMNVNSSAEKDVPGTQPRKSTFSPGELQAGRVGCIISTGPRRRESAGSPGVREAEGGQTGLQAGGAPAQAGWVPA